MTGRNMLKKIQKALSDLGQRQAALDERMARLEQAVGRIEAALVDPPSSGSTIPCGQPVRDCLHCGFEVGAEGKCEMCLSE